MDKYTIKLWRFISTHQNGLYPVIVGSESVKADTNGHKIIDADTPVYANPEWLDNMNIAAHINRNKGDIYVGNTMFDIDVSDNSVIVSCVYFTKYK